MEAEILEADAPSPARAGGSERPWFELRRSDLLNPAQVGIMQEIHQGFARAVARKMGNALRTLVRCSCTNADQRTYRSFARSIPTPCVVAPVSLHPLPGSLVLALPGDTALCLIDRLMGGDGRPCPLRAPTELELLLLADFLQLLIPPLAEAFESVVSIQPSMTAIEVNPALLRAIAPADMTLVLPHAVAFPGTAIPPTTVSVCYPVTALRAAFDLLAPEHPADPEEAATPTPGAAPRLARVGIDLSVHLLPTRIPAGDIAGLRVGDVLRLDHRTNEPALGAVRGVDVLQGSVGTRGGHLGFRVSAWRNNE